MVHKATARLAGSYQKAVSNMKPKDGYMVPRVQVTDAPAQTSITALTNDQAAQLRAEQSSRQGTPTLASDSPRVKSQLHHHCLAL